MKRILTLTSNSKKSRKWVLLFALMLCTGWNHLYSSTAPLDICVTVEITEGGFLTDMLFVNVEGYGNAEIAEFSGALNYYLASTNHEIPLSISDYQTSTLGAVGTEVGITDSFDAPTNTWSFEYMRLDGVNVPVAGTMARSGGCITTIDQLRTWSSPPVTPNSVFELTIELQNFEISQWDSTSQTYTSNPFVVETCEALTIWLEEIPNCELEVNIEGQTEVCVGDTITYTASVDFGNMLNPQYTSAVDTLPYYNDCDVIMASFAPCGYDGANEYVILRNNTGNIGINDIAIAAQDSNEVMQHLWGQAIPGAPVLPYNWVSPGSSMTASLTNELNTLAGCSASDPLFIEPQGDLIPDNAVIAAFLGAGDGNGFDDAANNLDFFGWCQFAPIYVIYGDASGSDYFNNTDVGCLMLNVNNTVVETVLYTPSSNDIDDQQMFVGCYGNVLATSNCNVMPMSLCYEWSVNDSIYPANESLLFTPEEAGNYDISLTAGACIACENTSNLIIEVCDNNCNDASVSILDYTDETCIGEDGSITIVIEGATPPYEIALSGGGVISTTIYTNDTITFEDLAASPYNVSIVDANGCIPECPSILLGVDDALVLDISMAALTCNEGIFGICDGLASVDVLCGTPPYSYQWSNGVQGFPEIKNLCEGEYSVTVTDSDMSIGVTSIFVSQPDMLTLDYAAVNGSTCGLDNGSVELAPGGGTPPYTVWIAPDVLGTVSIIENTVGNYTFNDLPPGNYLSGATDANGCIYECPIGFTITEDTSSPLIANITINPSCNGGNNGSIEVSATGGTPPYTYYIDNEIYYNDTIISGFTQGNYAIEIIDANGCNTQETANIGNASNINLTASITDLSCAGANDGSIDITVASPSLFGVVWSNGAITEDIDNLPAGNYTITVVSQGGCNRIETYTVNAPNELEVTLSATDLTCPDNSTTYNGQPYNAADGTANAIGTGGTPPYSYTWNTGATSTTIDALSAGNYTVTVEDDNGCSVIGTILVNSPTPFSFSIDTDDASCGGSNDGYINVNGSDSEGNPLLIFLDGVYMDTLSTFTNLAGGIYELSICNNDLCCEETSIEIEVVSTIEIDITVIDVSCFGEDNGQVAGFVSGGTPPYTIELDGVYIDGFIISDLAPGTYVYSATDINGCMTEEEITIDEPEQIIAESIDIQPACAGQYNGSVSVVATGGADDTYLYGINNSNWIYSDSGAAFPGLLAGDYTITLKNEDGSCAEGILVNIPEAYDTLAIGDLEVNGISCFGAEDGEAFIEAIGGIGPYAYRLHESSVWNFTGEFTDLSSGFHQIWIQDMGGGCDSLCVAISIPTSNVLCAPSGLIDDMIVSPVPTQKEATVSLGSNLNKDENYSIKVSDINGIPVMLSSLEKNKSSLYINVENWLPGMYSVTLYDHQGKILTTKRLIVAR